MADSKPSWKAEEEEEEEDYDENVSARSLVLKAMLTSTELRITERCRPIRHRCQFHDACQPS